MKNSSVPKTAAQNFSSVNLLPPEILLQRRQSSKLSFINTLSIVALIVLVFFTSATFALRLSQNLEFKKIETNFARAEEKVTGFKDQEGQIIMLKERLKNIQTLSAGDLKIKNIFNVIIYLIPPEIQISEISISRNGTVNLTINSSSLDSLNTFFSNLENKEKNSDLVAQIYLDGLSIGRDFVYKLSLKIIPK